MATIFWKPDLPLAGRYRAFFKRGWPTGWSDKTKARPIATFRCADEYTPARVKVGGHAPLKIYVAIRNEDRAKDGAFTWRALKGEWRTLAEAKVVASAFYATHPDLFLTETT